MPTPVHPARRPPMRDAEGTGGPPALAARTPRGRYRASSTPSAAAAAAVVAEAAVGA